MFEIFATLGGCKSLVVVMWELILDKNTLDIPSQICFTEYHDTLGKLVVQVCQSVG